MVLKESNPEKAKKAEAIGRQLRKLRMQKINPHTGKPYTIEQVAHESGLTYSALFQYEHGKRLPSPDNLEKLADFYLVSVDELLGRSILPLDVAMRAFLREKGFGDNDISYVLKLIELLSMWKGKQK